MFHVLHNYGSENISKAQILDCIRVFNEDFRRLNSDTTLTLPEFQGIAADCEIELRLAQIDPLGNCTDGIVRVASPLTYAAGDNSKLVSPAWPRDKYLNVWTVASIDGGAAGYSYYPASVDGTWGESRDGVLLLHSYVGSIGTSSALTSRTLTHEVGHYLNLMHTWGNSNTPGLPENCNDDDEVADTPNTIGHASCPLHANTCGELDNVQNYMEYSYCENMFTFGQRDRMHATLNTTVAGRNNLWTTQNLTETGTYDGYSAPPCIPVADFYGTPLSGCSAYSVTFKNISWNSDSIGFINWSFPGGNPSSSTISNPVVNYAAPGKYDVMLEVGNISGSDTLINTEYVNVVDVNSGIHIPVYESFESTTFPANADPDLTWTTTKTGNSGWARDTSAAFVGVASLSVPNNTNSRGDVSVLLTPNIITDSLGPYADVKFRIAYAQRNENSTDELRVWLSTDCGKTWKIRYTRIGTALVTNGGDYVDGGFIPDGSQWREEIVALGIFSSYPNIILKFECTSERGNKLYLDHVRLEGTTGVDENDFIGIYRPNIYPNPGQDISNLEWFSPKSETVVIEVSDLSGRVISNFSVDAGEGYNSFPVSKSYVSAGIYFVRIKTANGEGVLRMARE